MVFSQKFWTWFATIQYKANSMDLLSLLQLQEVQIHGQAEVITLLNAELTNRINLHLALGGSFEAAPTLQPHLFNCGKFF